jgi:hypothetical protein
MQTVFPAKLLSPDPASPRVYPDRAGRKLAGAINFFAET